MGTDVDRQLEIVRSIYPHGRVDLVPFVENEANEDWIVATWARHTHPDFEFAFSSPDFTGLARSFPGPAGWLEGMRMWLATWQSWTIELAELVPAGDKVLGFSDLAGVSRTAGIEITQRSSEVWTFRDGLILRCDAYLTREEGLAAAGPAGP
jgi:hypothetical protein